VSEVGIPKLPYGTPGIAYIVVAWPLDLEAASAGTISAVLKFLVKDCDPDTGLPDSDDGYDDEYVVGGE
jgi:coatomer protein complex subunit gamma